MKRLCIVLASVLFLAGVAAAAEDSYLSKLPPIIDREILFGDPVIAGGQLSPDGTHISFLKPYRNVLNIWVKGWNEPFDAARPVTADTTRPVREYFWSRDGKYILYAQDKGGDENYHVYAVDPRAKPETGRDVPPARDLTPYEKIAAQIYALPKTMPNVIFVGLNDRDQRYHDLYRLDIATGERVLLRRNDAAVVDWTFDLAGNLRLATRQARDGGFEILRVEPDTMIVVYACTKDEQVAVVRFHKDGARVYLATNRGAGVDLARLTLFDPLTGKEEYVESDPENEVDFGGAEFSEVTDELVATQYVGDRLRVYFRDKTWERDYRRLRRELSGGDLYLRSSTADDRFWLVGVMSDVDPGAAYLYDRERGKAVLLYRPYPNLPIGDLAPMKPMTFKARDGLAIHGYLTVPKGVREKNLPVLMYIHGGPWARDEWGYEPYAQFFANRGYAVFQPNFRASTGYGKAFLNAGKRQWGDAMQNDITDAVRFLVAKGIADPRRVGIFGGSYGGYAALAGLAFTPDLFAAGISYVGPSSLLTLLNSIPPYWEVMRAYFDEHVGDPNKPEDAERLKRQSPLFSATSIKAPLLVIQGANDPRVKKVESEQIVVALRDLGRDVEYLCAPDEGHGFAGRENRIAMAVAAERFLAKHLGGRVQESVTEEVARRLAAITVDVAGVKLPAKEADAADPATAPLPPADGAHLRPAKLVYRGKAVIMANEIPFELHRAVTKAAAGDRSLWRIASEQKTAGGVSVDTFDVDARNLMPVRWAAAQAQAKVVLEFAPAAVDGKVLFGPNEMPIKAELAAPVYGDGSSLEILLGALPLAPGYTTLLRVFDFQTQTARPMKLAVTGAESVEVPAGRFECHRVELAGLEGGPPSVVFVSVKDPRVIVRAHFEIPAAAGGGYADMDLATIE